MRIKITLKSGKNNLKIPFNYNHILSSIIYKKIDDLDLAYKLHASNSYKFFTFSQLYISSMKLIKDGFLSKDGVVSFYISSPDEYLIRSLVNGLLDDSTVKFQYKTLTIEKVEVLKEPIFSDKMQFITLSPIIVRIQKMIDDKLKSWDLAPGDQFFESLSNNLIKKYLLYNNLDSTNKKIIFYSEMNKVKKRRIAINKFNQETYHRSYMMDIIVEGDLDLIKFAYDVGIGEKGSMGFGMLDLINK